MAKLLSVQSAEKLLCTYLKESEESLVGLHATLQCTFGILKKVDEGRVRLHELLSLL